MADVNLNRIVRIERYWPQVFGALREAQQIAIAENPEFSLIWEHVRQFIADCFVPTAQEYIIKRWENMLGIIPLDSDSMTDRRNRILYFQSILLPYTTRKLKDIFLKQILGAGNYEVDVDPVACTIAVRINPAKASMFDDVRSMLDSILPCNMDLTLGYMGTSHNIMSQYTHNELEAYTHDEITNELMFEHNNN